MSYVDAYLDKNKDRIYVAERKNGERVYQDFPASYVFYYDDPKGKHTTLFGTSVSRVALRTNKEFRRELKVHDNKKLWESDFNPVFRCLEENYLGVDSPKLQTAFFDIEVGFDPERGFSSPDDPFNPITAISLYMDWMDKLVTLVVPPKTLAIETAQQICDKFDNTYLFESEKQLLDTFLNLIEDADVLSGWNSEGYDIPYTINRVNKIMSKDDTRRFCLWGAFPKERKFIKFGAEQFTFDLIGRVHMDYMQLYRKYIYEERHSFSLDAVAEHELGEKKIVYEGTLDQLYSKDFQKFIDYNRQDALLLFKLDSKLKYLDLANELAHDNTVLIPTTMGVVSLTEQAIINEAHQLNLVCPNRRGREVETSDDGAAGAYVAHPKKGMHDWIGGLDIKSLYPSTIRALNMAPETIVGQLKPVMTDRYIHQKMAAGATFAQAWEGLFGSLEYTAVMNQEKGTSITIEWENGETSSHSAAEVWKFIFDNHNPWILSANGTIFTEEKKGIVPGILAKWYSERQVMQKKKKEATTAEDAAFWDKRQLVKKINLNSLYGAILNPGCRFHDERIGQSTTLTGRIIARHMAACINELITNEYNHTGDAIIYGDTDSCYFSIWPIIKKEVESGKMQWDKDTCVALYDQLALGVNETFPAFMEQNCHCPREFGALISSGREFVATKGLFVKKKRYAVLIYDLEGSRLDLLSERDAKKKNTIYQWGKLKAMGLDLKRSDTPKVVQDFLVRILVEVLKGGDKEHVIELIKEFKIAFSQIPSWEKGTPKRVNKLTHYTAEEERLGKANLPGHVRAAMNWNKLKKMYSDNYSMKIIDGMKTIVCKLKNNPLGYTSVGYPIDELHLPEWFKELPFDDEAMEEAIVEQKIDNLLGILNWDLGRMTQTKSSFDALFMVEEDD